MIISLSSDDKFEVPECTVTVDVTPLDDPLLSQPPDSAFSPLIESGGIAGTVSFMSLSVDEMILTNMPASDMLPSEKVRAWEYYKSKQGFSTRVYRNEYFNKNDRIIE